jgi:hypothetical protein
MYLIGFDNLTSKWSKLSGSGSPQRRNAIMGGKGGGASAHLHLVLPHRSLSVPVLQSPFLVQAPYALSIFIIDTVRLALKYAHHLSIHHPLLICLLPLLSLSALTSPFLLLLLIF